MSTYKSIHTEWPVGGVREVVSARRFQRGKQHGQRLQQQRLGIDIDLSIHLSIYTYIYTEWPVGGVGEVVSARRLERGKRHRQRLQQQRLCALARERRVRVETAEQSHEKDGAVAHL